MSVTGSESSVYISKENLLIAWPDYTVNYCSRCSHVDNQKEFDASLVCNECNFMIKFRSPIEKKLDKSLVLLLKQHSKTVTIIYQSDTYRRSQFLPATSTIQHLSFNKHPQLFTLFLISLLSFMCSHWFFLGQDFAVRTVSMETVQSVYFCFEAKPVKSTFATKTAETTNRS